MKKLTTAMCFLFIAAFTAFGQSSRAEQELLKFDADFNQAQINRDVAFFERALADEYTFSGPTAEIEDKAKALAWLRGEKAKPTYKQVSQRTENVKARVIGNIGILTGDWVSTTLPLSDAQAEPHADRGRYTSILEKRNGQWVIIADHVSEAPHDRKLMETQVLKAGMVYGDIIKRQDAVALERLLADEYLFTDEGGVVKNKAEDIATYKTPAKFDSFDISDQKVRVIGNGAAVETGTVTYKGADRAGKPMSGSERYTTTWVWRGGRWQVAADHVSSIKAR